MSRLQHPPEANDARPPRRDLRPDLQRVFRFGIRVVDDYGRREEPARSLAVALRFPLCDRADLCDLTFVAKAITSSRLEATSSWPSWSSAPSSLRRTSSLPSSLSSPCCPPSFKLVWRQNSATVRPRCPCELLQHNEKKATLLDNGHRGKHGLAAFRDAFASRRDVVRGLTKHRGDFFDRSASSLQKPLCHSYFLHHRMPRRRSRRNRCRDDCSVAERSCVCACAMNICC